MVAVPPPPPSSPHRPPSPRWSDGGTPPPPSLLLYTPPPPIPPPSAPLSFPYSPTLFGLLVTVAPSPSQPPLSSPSPFVYPSRILFCSGMVCRRSGQWWLCKTSRQRSSPATCRHSRKLLLQLLPSCRLKKMLWQLPPRRLSKGSSVNRDKPSKSMLWPPV